MATKTKAKVRLARRGAVTALVAVAASLLMFPNRLVVPNCAYVRAHNRLFL